ncbi:hypothetical protein [Candidatus Ichthyocystis sparus]|uniref:hypothetical protein n=1 Tax=Candidatus Ichthyocystis sparus TaxID=1561004 RepID=UPI001146E927|nr:hypothetical protein [Candidatus Ichthyocystis sparus]
MLKRTLPNNQVDAASKRCYFKELVYNKKSNDHVLSSSYQLDRPNEMIEPREVQLENILV